MAHANLLKRDFTRSCAVCVAFRSSQDVHDTVVASDSSPRAGCGRAPPEEESVIPLIRPAGRPRSRSCAWNGVVNKAVGFCRRLCFRCQVLASVRLVRHLICSPRSCSSIRGRTGGCRISSRSSWRAACDERAARARKRSVSRACAPWRDPGGESWERTRSCMGRRWTRRWCGNGEELSILS